MVAPLGACPADLARVDVQNSGKSAPVKTFPADKTVEGASDFNGNVQEWCRDAWQPYRRRERPETDPFAAPADPAKAEYVVRGAGYDDIPDDCYLTRRLKRSGDDVGENLGFRVVIECPDARLPRH